MKIQPTVWCFGLISKLSMITLLISCLCNPSDAFALCGLQGAAIEAMKIAKDPESLRKWRLTLAQGTSYCIVCHESGRGPRNAYGNAIDVLLTGNDRFDPARMREAGQRVNEIPAYPVVKNSPTFGDLISQGVLPASGVASSPPIFKDLVPKQTKSVTVEQARELVKKAQAESSFGILQLSNMDTPSPEVAAELSKFTGEMLILGFPSLSSELAKAFVQSKVATIWLHSVTSVTPEAADIISKFSGNLAMTGLVELNSVSLAVKLSRRLSALALPYMGQVTPEIAEALSQARYGLNLAGLKDLSPECQEKLASTVGPLSLPNLKSLDSLRLTLKLALNTSIVLPNVSRLTVEQAQALAGIERPLYGGILLSLAAFTPEIASVFASNPNKFQTVGLSLAGAGPISDEALLKLVSARIPLTLQDVEKLPSELLEVIKFKAGYPDPPLVCEKPLGMNSNCNRCHRAGWLSALSLPGIRNLETKQEFDVFSRCAARLDGVRFVSKEASSAVSGLPDFNIRLVVSSYGLNLPSLETLDLESARRLMLRRFQGINFSALREISTEALKYIVGASSVITLGISNLTPEAASVFKDMYSTSTLAGGGSLCFSGLAEMSPESARELVKALNRGAAVDENLKVTYSRSPRLFIGGEYANYAATTQSFKLSPAVARELAKYDGMLAIIGLKELSVEAAMALSAYKGPRLTLLGPAFEKLPPDVAEALSRTDSLLELSLLELDSVPLAKKLLLQRNRGALQFLEKVSAQVIPEFSGYTDDFFELRNLKRLDSPELAKRLLQNRDGAVLTALNYISPQAAEVLLADSSKQVVLYLPMIDSVELAKLLAKRGKGVKLYRLRAVTPEVLAILKNAKGIETPDLETIQVISTGSRTP